MDELERFKAEINLSEYAAARGYEIDRKESARNSIVMRSGGDKIIVARSEQGHWIYFSVRDDADNGTIIDFVQKRDRLSLGEVRKELRSWRGGGLPVSRYAPHVEKTSKDRAAVVAAFAAAEISTEPPYLVERGLPPALLKRSRFAGRVRIDGRGNVLFPHFDKQGLCGFEVKNRGFTGFAKGGEKGLWASRISRDDLCAVFAETAVDALSYAALFPDDQTRYFSTGGTLNPSQPELIRQAVEIMRPDVTVILAMDNDAAGDELAGRIEQELSGRAVERHAPDSEGQDWNDVLSPPAPQP